MMKATMKPPPAHAEDLDEAKQQINQLNQELAAPR